MAFSPLAVFDRTVPRRIIFGVLLVAAVAGIVFAAQKGRGSTTAVTGRHSAIDALIPGEGADVLRQSQVGIDLVDGYVATLTLNGRLIPEAEITGDPGQGQYFFAPGPGRTVEKLQSGLNCVSATFWRAATGPDQSSIVKWCFSAA